MTKNMASDMSELVEFSKNSFFTVGNCKFCAKQKISFIYDPLRNKILPKSQDVFQNKIHKLPSNIIKVPDKICTKFICFARHE